MVQRHREEGENTSLVDGGFRYESKCKRPPARERGERRRGGGDGAEAAEPIDRSFPTGRRGANRGSDARKGRRAAENGRRCANK